MNVYCLDIEEEIKATNKADNKISPNYEKPIIFWARIWLSRYLRFEANVG